MMIHKFRMYDTNIVLDVNSGAVHLFDDLSYELLNYYEKYDLDEIKKKLAIKYDAQQIEEAYEEIKELVKDGLLFTEDIYREYVDLLKSKSVVKALCLHIAHDCNMRCKYCFASTGDFGVKRMLMPLEIAKKSIDFLIESSGGRRNLEVDFFGGEPLLNFDVVKETVLYALDKEKGSGKNFRFTITTNALLLNEENKKFINEHMGNVVLSIDGRQEVNDNMRVRVDGRGTYGDIITKIVDMAESRGQDKYYARGTFTRENLDFSKDVLHLADLGLKQISVEPVVAAADAGYALREEDLPVLFNEYEKLVYEYVKRSREGHGFNFFHFMLDFDHGPCAIKRAKGCGSGYEYLAVTPEGDIYPCHQFVGIDEFKMGNVNKGTELKTDISDRFRDSNIYSKDSCMECWARFYCSGGCTANAYQFNKDMDKPYAIGCELEKKRLECALWAKAALI